MNGADIIGSILWGMAMAVPPPGYYPPPRPQYYAPPPPPAQQAYPYPNPFPYPADGLYRTEFNCIPPLDGSKNPVVQINVTLAFRLSDRQFVSIKVLHRFANGSFINRWSQYPNASVSYQEGIFGWKGNYNRDATWVMAGGLYQDQRGWNYREKQWQNTTPSFDQTASCVQYSGTPVAQIVTPPANAVAMATPSTPTATPTPVTAPPPIAQTIAKDAVPIYSNSNGRAVLVDVLVGGHPTRMLLDTGATHGSISKDLATTLVREGNAEYLTDATTTLADGSKIMEPVVKVKEYRIGGHTVKDVVVAVSNGQMLLGFSTLNAIGTFTIDTRKNQLVFNGG